MTVPLPDARLAEIRERARRMISDKVIYASLQYAEDYSVLLAEVDRLIGALADRHYDAPCMAVLERDELRTRVVRYEAAIAAVAVQAAEWAALPPSEGDDPMPDSTVLLIASDVGRLLQRLMAVPVAAVEDGGQ